MATKYPRILVNLEKSIMEEVVHLANKENQSISGAIRGLVIEALELREDLVLSKLGEKLDKPNNKVLSHDRVWDKNK